MVQERAPGGGDGLESGFSTGRRLVSGWGLAARNQGLHRTVAAEKLTDVTFGYVRGDRSPRPSGARWPGARASDAAVEVDGDIEVDVQSLEGRFADRRSRCLRCACAPPPVRDPLASSACHVASHSIPYGKLACADRRRGRWSPRSTRNAKLGASAGGGGSVRVRGDHLGVRGAIWEHRPRARRQRHGGELPRRLLELPRHERKPRPTERSRGAVRPHPPRRRCASGSPPRLPPSVEAGGV